jgi:hypothetical protein
MRLFVLKVVDFEQRAKIKFWIVGKSSVAENLWLDRAKSRARIFRVEALSIAIDLFNLRLRISTCAGYFQECLFRYPKAR